MEKLVDDLNKLFKKYKVSPEDVQAVQNDFADLEGGGDVMSDGGNTDNSDFIPPDQNSDQPESYGG